MKNAFRILKKSFKKLFLKTNAFVLFRPNVMVYHCIPYNMILDGKDLDIDTLMV